MLALLLFLSCAFLQCSGMCLANDQGEGTYATPCSFPFLQAGKRYSQCLKYKTTDKLWCPTETNETGYTKPDKWGFCLCQGKLFPLVKPLCFQLPLLISHPLVDICPNYQEVIAEQGLISTTPPDSDNYPALNCTWHVVNPKRDTQRVPTSIFFATGYRLSQAEVFVCWGVREEERRRRGEKQKKGKDGARTEEKTNILRCGIPMIETRSCPFDPSKMWHGPRTRSFGYTSQLRTPERGLFPRNFLDGFTRVGITPATSSSSAFHS
jgi:hypothetical protein